MSYYDVLGVTSAASERELRRAYLELARRYHPDFHGAADPRVRAANERAMQAVNEAWAVLGDPRRRADYDARRSSQANQAGGAAGAGRSGTRDRWDRWEAGTSASDAADAARKAWRPLDDSPDPDDPAAEHDTPITPVRVPRPLTMIPVVLLVGGFVVLVFGLFVALREVAAVGFAAILASLPLFLAAPLYALAAQRRDDDHP